MQYTENQSSIPDSFEDIDGFWYNRASCAGEILPFFDYYLTKEDATYDASLPTYSSENKPADAPERTRITEVEARKLYQATQTEEGRSEYDEPPMFTMTEEERQSWGSPNEEDEGQKYKSEDAQENQTGPFKIATMNQWLSEASKKPIPKRLCDDFWFEGEICFLFAATNQGKSVKAVQIGERIAIGKSDSGFRVETDPQRVIYFDFELTAKQVEKRYSENYTNHYQFSPNFIRVEIDPDRVPPTGVPFEQYILMAMKEAIQREDARVVIVDNITFLNANSEASKDAGPFIIGLQQLKRQLSLSMLIIGHTPKTDPSRPITRNDLQGSSRLAQLIDSMFAIGASMKDPSIKYFKQIKARAVPYEYEADNVIVCQLHQPHNFLRFDFMEYGHEQDHLKVVSEDDRKSMEAQVFALKAEGKSQTQIAEILGISQSKVSRIFKKNAPDS